MGHSLLSDSLTPYIRRQWPVSSQAEDAGLLPPFPLPQAGVLSSDVQPLFPVWVETVLDEGFASWVGDRVWKLFKLAVCYQQLYDLNKLFHFSHRSAEVRTWLF